MGNREWRKYRAYTEICCRRVTNCRRLNTIEDTSLIPQMLSVPLAFNLWILSGEFYFYLKEFASNSENWPFYLVHSYVQLMHYSMYFFHSIIRLLLFSASFKYTFLSHRTLISSHQIITFCRTVISTSSNAKNHFLMNWVSSKETT